MYSSDANILLMNETLAKVKRLRDENKNEKLNRFVNDLMTNLSEEKKKKVPFLTNQARALRAYSEGSVQRVSIYLSVHMNVVPRSTRNTNSAQRINSEV